jgi:adenylate cyclase
MTAAIERRVLIVDDEPAIRSLLEESLASWGYEPVPAASGAEAWEIFQRADAPALAMIDWMMPGMDGVELLLKVRGLAKPRRPYLIFVTSMTRTDDVVTALEAGADDYVVKPFQPDELRARLRVGERMLELHAALARRTEQLDARNRFIRRTFGRYLSEEVVTRLLGDQEALAMGGQRRKVTVLMSDLRGFTAVVERLSPEAVVKMLNHYLGVMTEVIREHGGTIDEFIGDAILVIFGAPIARPDDAAHAVACAVDMQLAMVDVNAFNRRQGLPPLEMGIAVNTGEVVVGNIGSALRAKYGAVGRTITEAARLESLTVGGQVLIAEATRADIGPAARVGDRLTCSVKGVGEPLTAFDLTGIGGTFQLDMPPRDRRLQTPTHELPVEYALIEGKQVGPSRVHGRVVRLSRDEAEIWSDDPPAPLADLRLELTAAGEPSKACYAKVVGPASERGCFRVRFTFVPPEVAAVFSSLLPAI